VTSRLLWIVVPVLVVGLALHNVVMAELWDLGVRGAVLDVVAAWKEALLALALVLGLWASRGLPTLTWPDRLAIAYTAVVLVYAVIPQAWLGGDATTRGVLYALRHDLTPIAAYALGRIAGAQLASRRTIAIVVASTATGVALLGLVDVYLVPLQWWRDSGVPGWFGNQLGLDYGPTLSGLPENWVYNLGEGEDPLRRLVSTFLSPLAAAYMLVVALLLLAARRTATWVQWLVIGVALAGLLFTHTRAAYLALAGGLLVLAVLQRRLALAAAAVVVVAGSLAFVVVYDEIGPSTSYTRAELDYLRDRGAETPGASTDPLSPDESSISSHLRNLRDGLERVVRHPQGFGLGNAGVTASRTGVRPEAGESTYTEIGVETGVLGMLLFAGFALCLLAEVAMRSPGVAAALAAVLALGLQTDVIGVHWLAYVVFALAGAAVARRSPTTA
jgi:hypothetical protein